ncbi:MAG: SCO family protein [Planctomycetes bacterium]|nr:SCO family protein [Planctomycetota bacterium]
MTACILLAGFVCGSAEQAPRLHIIQAAPAFVLSDQSGKNVALADLKGKVLIVGFIFTTCNGSCPATTSRMVLLQEELKRRGQWGKDVQLLSITLDPVRDTPQKLRSYMGLYDIDARGWSFLTGPAKQVKRVIADWGMWVKKAANEQLDHPSRVFLLDRRGRIREIYNLEFFRIPWVLEDIGSLLKE